MDLIGEAYAATHAAEALVALLAAHGAPSHVHDAAVRLAADTRAVANKVQQALKPPKPAPTDQPKS